MFENYLANKKDLKAIEEAISVVWQKELDFIFNDKNLIKNVIVISYDSKYIYFWTKILLPKYKKLSTQLKDYNFYKIRHNINIDDNEQLGWYAGLKIEKIAKYLPKKLTIDNYQYPKISGCLLQPFIKSHINKKDAYDTKESYLATIVHEFGHVYFDQHKLFWYSDKKENLNYLRTALNLYNTKKPNLKNIKIRIPSYMPLTELYAFCVEYTVANLFWTNFKNKLDKINSEIIKKLIKREIQKKLNIQNSSLEEDKGGHIFALTIGKIILSRYPDSWSQKILSQNQFD